jgi:hypothetical protein
MMDKAGFLDRLGRENVCANIELSLARSREILGLPFVSSVDLTQAHKLELEAARQALTQAFKRADEALGRAAGVTRPPSSPSEASHVERNHPNDSHISSRLIVRHGKPSATLCSVWRSEAMRWEVFVLAQPPPREGSNGLAFLSRIGVGCEWNRRGAGLLGGSTTKAVASICYRL